MPSLYASGPNDTTKPTLVASLSFSKVWFARIIPPLLVVLGVNGSINILYPVGLGNFSVRVSVGVSYDSDLEKVARITNEVADNVAKSVDGCSKKDKPLVRFFEFGDSSINLKVYFKAEKYGDQHNIIDVFIRRLHERYNKEGIDIPFPIRTLIHQNSPK